MEIMSTFAHMKPFILHRWTVAVLAMVSCCPNMAAAADEKWVAGVGLSDTSRVVDLDEVVVISMPKESSSLRSQAASSTVFTHRELANLNVTALNQLSSYVPSFVMPAYGSRLTSSIYMRGIGSRMGSPSVGLYYDHIPLASKSTYNQHFYDIDRVDVFRGPQGTLYGINTEAGLVRVFTRDPMRYQGTDLSAGFAGGGQCHAELSHHHRFSSSVAASMSGFYSGQRGFFRHAILSERTDKSHEAGARLRLVASPYRQLKVDFMADYQYVDQNGFGYGEYDDRSGHWQSPASTLMNGYRRQMVNGGLHVSYKSDHLLFSSSTGYQYLDDAMRMDQDYLPQDFMRLRQEQRLNAVTQELTLRAQPESGIWQHTSGLFFSHQWTHTNAPVLFGDAMNRMIADNITQAMIGGGAPPQMVNSMNIHLADNRVPGHFNTPQLDFALYHETRLQLLPSLLAIVGLRYDLQRMAIDYDTEAGFTFRYSYRNQDNESLYRSALNSSTHDVYQQLIPKFSLTYLLPGHLGNVYAVVSKGFRAGGYNLQMFSDIFQTEQAGLGMKLMQLAKGDLSVSHSKADYGEVNRTISYQPETCWNYETGAHMNLFDHRLSLDATLFFMQIRNQQLSVMAGNYRFGRMMVNAGRSASYGGELALRGCAADNRLEWTATYGYTHSTFRQYTDKGVDYRGKRVPFVPAHTLSAQADYLFAVSRAASVTVGADVTATGPVYWDADNKCRQNFYALVGTHVLFRMAGWSLNLWGKNLTRTHYNTFLVQSSVDGVTRSFAQRGNPVHFGADLRFHF